VNPALKLLTATSRLLPDMTINIVRIDLIFLSLRASKDSIKVSLMFII
jgi:hypothetical protein